jgi:hypothetical protein
VRARSAWALRACASLVAVLTTACSSATPPSEGGDAADSPFDGGDAGMAAPTYQPTYSAIWDEILSPRCALPFCHGGSADYLQLQDKATGYASLVSAPAAGPDCAPTGLLRVHPGDPEASLFYLKVTAPPCGSRMPIQYGAPEYLDSRQTTQIHQWIEAGAPNN